MIQFILGLFGCNKAHQVTKTATEAGPFTIETITRKDKTWNANYGRVNQTTISYEVKYKGEALSFEEGLETNTGLPGIWRVFYLQEAVNPTLILGSQSVYLVTLENEKPVIKLLSQQGSDFASIQWLDSEAGQPGEYREIFSSDEFDTETKLSGGRYMVITHSVVLDTKTLDIYPYNTNNKNEIDGFHINGWNALAFSPDSTQLVYLGSKNDTVHYMLTHPALLSYNFKTGETYAVPFDKTAFKLKDEFKITPEWVADHFEWTKQDDGKIKLVAKSADHLPFQKGLAVYTRYKGYSYTLDPVKESMRDHLSAYIQAELKLDPSQIYKIDGDYLNRIYASVNDIKLMMIYGEFGQDLVLKQEEPLMPIHMEQNKALITRLSKGFNAILSTGQFSSEWEPIPPPDLE